MHYKHMYPSFKWVVENAAAIEDVREEKRRAPTFFPAPSVFWMPPKGNKRARIFFGPPTPYYPYCRRAPRRPKTPKLRAVDAKDDIPALDLDKQTGRPQTSDEQPKINEDGDIEGATVPDAPSLNTVDNSFQQMTFKEASVA